MRLQPNATQSNAQTRNDMRKWTQSVERLSTRKHWHTRCGLIVWLRIDVRVPSSDELLYLSVPLPSLSNTTPAKLCLQVRSKR